MTAQGVYSAVVNVQPTFKQNSPKMSLSYTISSPPNIEEEIYCCENIQIDKKKVVKIITKRSIQSFLANWGSLVIYQTGNTQAAVLFTIHKEVYMDNIAKKLTDSLWFYSSPIPTFVFVPASL